VDEFLTELWNRFKTLPFALRWLIDKYDEIKARRYLDILIKRRNVHAYPILVEGNGKTVAQAEHTFIPLDSSINIITL
jgi:methionyl aminopeptidase